ncbi:MAG: hypothetical protein CV089_13990 [Nitrospira sp. WS110]|nr:hypothetical protein [Nitrospira sp. WS110]
MVLSAERSAVNDAPLAPVGMEAKLSAFLRASEHRDDDPSWGIMRQLRQDLRPSTPHCGGGFKWVRSLCAMDRLLFQLVAVQVVVCLRWH